MTQEYGSDPGSPTADRAPRWREALPSLAAAFVVSRLLVLLVAGALTAIPLGHDPATWTDRPFLDVLTGSKAARFYLRHGFVKLREDEIEGAYERPVPA